jgi:outer membrane protein insertion porin family
VGGQNFDRELIDRDVRASVRAYSPFGFIYQPQSQDPDFIRIEPRTIFRREAGTVELVYDISEGKPFRLGNVIVRGNTRTQDKVIRRELRVQSGELYNSSSLQDTADRLRTLPMFSRVQLTPIGDDPFARDVLIEVEERRTATLTFGAGINSNGGVGGNITYEQRNFDITNWPRSFGDLFTDRAFTGAGQTFRATFEPGTQQTNASIRFTEPWIFDQPYSFTGEAYLRNRTREDYIDRRIGGRVTLGKRFDDIWSGSLTLRGEQVDVGEISDREVRAFEILDVEGEQFLTSLGLSVRRDTTNRGLLPWRGTTTSLSWESFGLLGGDHTFQRLAADFTWYKLLHEDLVERKTIFMFNLNAGYIIGDAPVFETLYGGGIGSIRGFEFRGVSPRSGPDDDRVGGKFLLTGTAEVSFPLYSDNLRGVVFSDFGTVESDFEIGSFRSSIGVGIRLTIPALGQIPIALDFAIPLTKDSKDDTQIFSFSLGITQ